MKVEAVMGVVPPLAMEPVGPPEAGRGKADFCNNDCEGSTALLTPSVHTSGLQNCERGHFCCFKPLSLW